MPIIILVLIFGVLVYLFLTRNNDMRDKNCRWRQDRAAQAWDCSYCGARIESDSNAAPTECSDEDRDSSPEA